MKCFKAKGLHTQQQQQPTSRRSRAAVNQPIARELAVNQPVARELLLLLLASAPPVSQRARARQATARSGDGVEPGSSRCCARATASPEMRQKETREN
ncbi:hypothetical protein GPALN_007418, partial [Globodera pallida]